MNDPNRVLLVDDEPEICSILSDYLSSQGFQVTSCHNGETLRRIVEQSTIDIVLLDLMLPGDDGLALARWLRARNPDIGIMMLTGRGETIDRIIGLEMGADDYLAKPFHLREVLARINSLSRRIGKRADGLKLDERRCVRFAGWLFDRGSHELTSPTGDKVPLTAGEYELLTAFVTHPFDVLTRDRLLDLGSGREGDVFDRTIDVRIGRLRQKLNDHASRSRLIKTVRGGGYCFTAKVEAATPLPGAIPSAMPTQTAAVAADRLHAEA